jgi:hypothetical protein
MKFLVLINISLPEVLPPLTITTASSPYVAKKADAVSTTSTDENTNDFAFLVMEGWM